VPLLNVALVPGPGQVVVRLTGDCDLSTEDLLSDALAQAAGLGSPDIVVDVSGARFWDCSGLHVLAGVTAALGDDGRGCRIVGATPQTRRLVVLADFTGSLDIDGPVHEPGVAGRRAPRRATVERNFVADVRPEAAAPWRAPDPESVAAFR